MKGSGNRASPTDMVRRLSRTVSLTKDRLPMAKKTDKGLWNTRIKAFMKVYSKIIKFKVKALLRPMLIDGRDTGRRGTSKDRATRLASATK